MSQLELRTIALTADRPLVHDVSLTLRAGRVLALAGNPLPAPPRWGYCPPGCGKPPGKWRLTDAW